MKKHKNMTNGKRELRSKEKKRKKINIGKEKENMTNKRLNGGK